MDCFRQQQSLVRIGINRIVYVCKDKKKNNNKNKVKLRKFQGEFITKNRNNKCCTKSRGAPALFHIHTYTHKNIFIFINVFTYFNIMYYCYSSFSSIHFFTITKLIQL